MDLKMNPRVPTQEHLEYYYQTFLIPRYLEEREEYEVGGGETIKIPGIRYKKTTLKPDTTFERGGRQYRPKDMFFEQNKGKTFAPLSSKFKKKNVDKRVSAATKMPKLTFSLKPVKLIKPRYGKQPKSVFK